MILTKEGIVWFDITKKALDIEATKLFELYAVYDDNTEALIESSEQLNKALKNNVRICIEVGKFGVDVKKIYSIENKSETIVKLVVPTKTKDFEFLVHKNQLIVILSRGKGNKERVKIIKCVETTLNENQIKVERKNNILTFTKK